ncbi:MAG: methionine--tRNA ligase [Bacteroidetes bacterium]|nr:methionine--tRNA ligase [Bacteroidota bacterium]
MSESKKHIVTAALPYANGRLHLGHIAGAYLPSDIYVRYKRLKKENIIFVCGSDEHGVAITISAIKEKTTPKAIVDKYHEKNKIAFQKMGISFDIYSRTSNQIHHKTSQEFFLELNKKGILVEKTESQLYCENDKMFLSDRFVEGTCPKCKSEGARGDQCENCGSWLNPTELISPKCKLCSNKPIIKSTKHFYFPLGRFQNELEKYVSSKKNWKPNVKNYCNGWFKEKLGDRAVTRDLEWGIKVPLNNADGKVLYVWFEAVLGYISATKEFGEKIGDPNLWKNYWQDPSTTYTAFIGKDNIVFHAIVFPAMLMAHGNYLLPQNIPANEFLNLEGGKFSKSRNNAIYLEDVVEKYSVDALRYTLASILPETKDSDFYWKDFQARTNNELADIYGNFINRTTTFIQKNFNSKIPAVGALSSEDKNFLKELNDLPQKVGDLFEKFKFRDANNQIMDFVRIANKYFNDSMPWKTLNSHPEKCKTTLNNCINAVQMLAVVFFPILPDSSKKIWKMIGNNSDIENINWNEINNLKVDINQTLVEIQIPFSKIEDNVIQEELNKLENQNNVDIQIKEMVPIKPIISFEDFQKVDLRVATILSCENIPKSKKLVKLEVELGNLKKQIIAGIAQEVEPSSLVGKQVVIVANLQVATLMGLESQGMVLTTAGTNDTFALVSLNKNVPSGINIK